MSSLSWKQFKAGATNWSFSVDEPGASFFAASKRAFLRSYTRQGRAEKILDELLSTEFLPLVLRHGYGKGHLLQMIFDVAEQVAAEGDAYDKDLSDPNFILMLLVFANKIPTPPSFAVLWSYFDQPRNSPEQAETDYSRLRSKLDASDEWNVRELVLRSGFLVDRIDEDLALKENFSREELCARILSNYKQINKNILNDDFDEARQGGQRKYRFAPRKGEGALYKQVGLRLHPDTIEALTKAVGEGNRNAWIEEAIHDRLSREGFEMEPVQQPPVRER